MRSARHGVIRELRMSEEDAAIYKSAHCRIDVARPSEHGGERLSYDRDVEQCGTPYVTDEFRQYRQGVMEVGTQGTRGEGDAPGGIVCEKVFENLCSGLFVLSELLKVFGATDLGKGSECLHADEWLFITDTLHERDPQGVVHILTRDGRYKDTMEKTEHILELAQLGDDLCHKTDDAVANILVFSLESFEEVL